jgi:site-specific recombinase XerD
MFPVAGRSRNHLRRILERACNSAGVQYKGIHALRHTFASQLAMNGTSLRKIQKLLGHSDYKMTEIYAHLLPSEMDSDVEKLEFNR